MSDSQDHSRFGLVRLNESNYFTWKQRMQLFLIKDDLWCTIAEPTPIPTTPAWERKNQRARAEIGLLLEDKYLTDIKGMTSAKEVWDKLEATHQRNTLENRLVLSRALFSTRYIQGKNMADHLSHLTDTAEKLSDLGHPVSEVLICTAILGSLPDEYTNMITAIESRNSDTISVTYVREKVTEEYNRRNPQTVEPQEYTRALVANKNTSPYSPQLTCYYCNRVGHVRRDCRTLIRHREHQNLRSNAPRGRGAFRGRNQRDYYDASKEKAAMTTDSETVPNITLLSMSDHPPLVKEAKALIASAPHPTSHPEKWIIDSGACNHMCSRSDTLSNYTISQDAIFIQSAGGRTGRVEGTGDYVIRIKDPDGHVIELTLTGVYHVPSITDNLISVSRLMDMDYQLRFKRGTATLITATGVYTLGTRTDSLYTYVDDLPGPETAALCEHSWHVRLGHRNMRDTKTTLDSLREQGVKISPCTAEQICPTCETSKMSNKPFTENPHPRAEAPFLKLHTDVCGPIQPTSLGMNRYILTVIDDHSRYAKVFMLKHKNEASEHIKTLIRTGTNKFGYPPQTLRSDGGGEYACGELSHFLDSMGITHETSLPYTPQLNGIAERYNRTLINAVRCLLEEGKFPKYLWGEMASTANYLLNLNLSKDRSKTPYYLWHGRDPMYHHLRAVGTTCYHLDTYPHKRKLDPRASPGVLIGYGQSMSFYRIWSMRDKKVYISRCLSFHPEHCPITDITKGSNPLTSDTTLDDGDPVDQTPETPDQVVPEELRKSHRTNQGKPPMLLTYDHRGQQGSSEPDWYVQHKQIQHPPNQ